MKSAAELLLSSMLRWIMLISALLAAPLLHISILSFPKVLGIKASLPAPSSSIPESPCSLRYSETRTVSLGWNPSMLPCWLTLKEFQDFTGSCNGSLMRLPLSPSGTGAASVPDHNKLQHYNTRRLAHVIKLCMVASIARTSDLRITLDDYQTALGWLLEVETYIPDLFNSHGVSGDTAAIDDAWDFIFRAYNKEGKKPVLEHRVVNFLRTKVPSHSIMKIIEIMERSSIIKGEITTIGKAFHPAPKA
jgi:hypothetical protein